MSAAVMEPRAERVPSKKPRGEEPLFEVVHGKKEGLPAMSAFSNQIANLILFHFFRFLDNHPLGTAVGETLFGIPTKDDPTKQRRPDVAYLSKERWPLGKQAPDSDPWPAVPNLVVEVLSPTDRHRHTNDKIEEYFEAGVQLVWIVDPPLAKASIYTSPTQVTIIDRSGTLEGNTVLPGFTLPMMKLFPGEKN